LTTAKITWLVAVSFFLVGCAGAPPSPTTPTALASTTNWLVTHRFVSVSGPDNCWVRQQRDGLTGVVFQDLPMTITRSGASIILASPFFDVNYAGTVTGSTFAASGGPLPGGGRPCADGTSFQQMAGTSDLTGRFVAGDQQLTGTEVNSYRLMSGEPVVYTWDWQAARQN